MDECFDDGLNGGYDGRFNVGFVKVVAAEILPNNIKFYPDGVKHNTIEEEGRCC